ncbi:ABC-F family ATP-binding cassette domain-containing protein [Pedobacter xixiisoli]|uniref:ATPase components of ABC transporters with duplicated ATPase domains n=1 Tax=Pedobacter xixiisoli TaxID=1476464 RepID=A0A286A0R3_9SPHI|nr:ABC-F family ATP-binding cassette domain-containing protein [Pedobacter xixiisoli]SOD15489.1 ATPase components of ABC transporters with duplicated ATPase domains [Pedobacter xixiisoli]
MLTLQNISYIHPNKELLFDGINLTINPHDKIALIGNNGIGKSILLKIITKALQPSAGQITIDQTPYYVPQVFGQFNELTVAQALGIQDKLHALQQILDGNASEKNFHLLNDDWTIEERCKEALEYWNLKDIKLSEKMASLSGGQKTKVFLAGIQIHQAELILLDEPSNHLDIASRELLYQFIQNTKSTLLIISHDRKLLNLLNTVCELTTSGIHIYGGNYDFYAAQKQIESNALSHDIQNKEKALRKAKEKEQETSERQQKQDARGKKKQEKAGVARIMMNTLRNNAENSTAKIKDIHTEKIGGITEELRSLRTNIADIDQMKFGFDNAKLHKGKILFKASNLNYSFGNELLWKESLNLQINSGERIALKGANGSGKTTLIKLILGNLEGSLDEIYQAIGHAIYIDQDYSLIDNELSIYEQAQNYNTNLLQEHEVKIRLNRFLFGKDDWNKLCKSLSGGEKMRLMLCCLTIKNIAPDLIILDEPTNNLDIQNVEILTAAINEYEGTLIVVSHDEYFLKRINMNREINLS